MKRTRKIHGDMTLPHRFISLHKRRGFHDAGVVDQDIGSATKLFVNDCERALDITIFGHVAFDGGSLCALRANFSRDLVTFRACARRETNARAFACKSESYGATNTAASAGDECESVL